MEGGRDRETPKASVDSEIQKLGGLLVVETVTGIMFMLCVGRTDLCLQGLSWASIGFNTGECFIKAMQSVGLVGGVSL